jgi:hypothetical protein
MPEGRGGIPRRGLVLGLDARHAKHSSGVLTAWPAFAGSSPTIVVAPSVNNGAVVFSGSEYLTCNPLATTFSGEDVPCTMVLVETTDSSGLRIPAGFGSSTSNNPIHATYRSATQAQGFHRDDTNATDTTPSAASGATAITSYVFDGTSGTVQGDGASASGSQDVGTLTLDRFAIGCLLRASTALFWEGDLHALLVYDRALPANELRNIRNTFVSRIV